MGAEPQVYWVVQLPYSLRRLGQRVFGDVRVRILAGPNRGFRWSLAALGRGYGSGRFGRDRLEALAAVVQPGDALWDIGAHKGFVTLAGSRMVGPLGAVVAIEPALDNLRFLERHIAWNGVHNVRVVAAAVSDRVGSSNIGGPGSSIAFRLGRGTQEVAVSTVELLAVKSGLGRPTVMKIDVEGEEAAVLRGAKRLLGTDQAILVSTHGRELYQECRALLEPLGFRIHESWEIAQHMRNGTPWTSDHDFLAVGFDRAVEQGRIASLPLFARRK